MFCAKKGELESHQLPACLDCLTQHCKRVNYQTLIWKNSLESNPNTPSSVDNGRRMENGGLLIDLMLGNPAPDEILEF